MKKSINLLLKEILIFLLLPAIILLSGLEAQAEKEIPGEEIHQEFNLSPRLNIEAALLKSLFKYSEHSNANPDELLKEAEITFPNHLEQPANGEGFRSFVLKRDFLGQIHTKNIAARFRSIIMPLIIFQIFSFLNPAFMQAEEILMPAEEQIGAADYKNEHIVTIIPGTNLAIHTHFGPQEGKHNNVLGDWVEAAVKGVVQPDADIVRLDWHADDKGVMEHGDEQRWHNIQNLKNPQDKIQVAREIAAKLGIDAFNYPAYLTGPTGKPILGRTFWIRQETEWQSDVEEQNIVIGSNMMLVTDNPERYPERKKIKRYNLNAKDLLLVDSIHAIKNGFILDIDLDYFALYRGDMDWGYLKELLNSNDESLRKLAKVILKRVYYQPSRQEMQKNIDLFFNRIEELAKREKLAGIVTISESRGFTPNSDAAWVKEQLMQGLIKIYKQYASLPVSPRAEKIREKSKNIALKAQIMMDNAEISDLGRSLSRNFHLQSLLGGAI